MPAQITALRERLHLEKNQFGDLLETSRGHMSKLERGIVPVMPGSLAILLRWMFSAFVIEGGEPPHPRIPVVRAGPTGVAVWDDEPEVDPKLLEELRVRTGLTKKKDFAELLGMTYGNVYKMENEPRGVPRGAARVLLRWLFAVYGLPGGRTPHPSIPVVRVE